MSVAPVLAVEDAEDLAVVSARLQDAVARVEDLGWLPIANRFAAMFNRFKWEDAEAKTAPLRTRSGLRFERVISAKSRNIRHGDPEAVLSLLAIRFEPNGAEDPGGTVELIFSGGGAIRLDVECLEAALSDVSGDWAALGFPQHPAEPPSDD